MILIFCDDAPQSSCCRSPFMMVAFSVCIRIAVATTCTDSLDWPTDNFTSTRASWLNSAVRYHITITICCHLWRLLSLRARLFFPTRRAWQRQKRAKAPYSSRSTRLPRADRVDVQPRDVTRPIVSFEAFRGTTRRLNEPFTTATSRRIVQFGLKVYW